jgi:hypothetical protein
MKRSETVRNGERSEKFILYKINGLKRLQNHVHGSKTKETLYNLTKNIYWKYSLSKAIINLLWACPSK